MSNPSSFPSVGNSLPKRSGLYGSGNGLDLDSVGVPWVLVGGNMVTLHCLEHGHERTRTTNDGDIVVDVWTARNALRQVTSSPS